MIKGKNILAVIPARGGSKGIPRKNIKPLAGKPLIVWTIEQALACKYFDNVFVSTDSEEIAEVSRKYKVELPFLRPGELARDDSPTIDTIIHTLDYYEKNGQVFDILVLLEPTSPLRKKDDLNKAIDHFMDNYDRADALVSLGEIHMENPFIVKKVEENYVGPLIETKSNFYQRQLLPKTYFPYGAIYLSKVETLRSTRTFYQKRAIPYYLERWQNYEVDDIFDFECIEAILKLKREEIE